MQNELTTTGKDNMLSLITNNPIGDLIKPLQHEIFLFDSYVAGTTGIGDKSILDELTEGEQLTLKREPDNSFDDNAILITDSKGRKLGYVPEKDNTVFTRLMDAGKYLTARVGGTNSIGTIRQISISIYLVDY